MGALPTSLSLPRSRPHAVDLALAGLFALGAGIEVLGGSMPGPVEAKVSLALLTTVPLAWRSVAPVAVVAVTAAGFALGTTLGVPPDEPLLPLLAPLVAVYSLGAHGSWRAIAVGCAAGMIAYAAALAGAPEAEPLDLLPTVGAMLGAIAVGRAVRVMGFEADVLEARASEAERQRDERARAAVAAERARIARELHDVIGHSISVMGVQAGAVRRLLAPEQARERDALLTVERIGRDSVEEMQRLLGFLRASVEDEPPSAPLTRERLERLAGEMRGAGLRLDLRVEGELDDLPAGRGTAAFRIVQEALTNVLKHAPGARATATLRRTAAELRIEVADDGGPGAGGGARGSGQGLVGMRERASLYGGTLDAGPRPGGGFRVEARLPEGGG